MVSNRPSPSSVAPLAWREVANSTKMNTSSGSTRSTTSARDWACAQSKGSPRQLTSGSSDYLNRIPDTVFLIVGHSRPKCFESGMQSCTLELGASNDYDWKESTLNFVDSDEMDVFLSRSGTQRRCGPSGLVSLTLVESGSFVGSFQSINSFVDTWRRNRYLRLGPRHRARPCDLSPSEVGLVMLPRGEFERRYLADPRGRPSFSEVLGGVQRHAPLLRGQAAPDHVFEQSPRGSFDVLLHRTYRFPVPLKPRLRDWRGKPLQSRVRLQNRVNALFYSLPLEARRTKLPAWMPEVLGKPRYLFRIPGRSLSASQRVVSTLCRVYYWYRFVLARGPLANTSKLLKLMRCDNIYRVLAQPSGPGWYTMASIVYRRLKVLLSPLMGITST